MGVELTRRYATPESALWSAQALIDNPDAVVQVHLDFIAAGARMITTNSYSTVPSYLEAAGIESRHLELTALAGELARRAATESGEDVRVAGGLPPLAESYRADLVPADDEARPIYTDMASALEPHIDLFLCETMSIAREGRNAALAAKQAAENRRLPVYISWSLNQTPGEGLRGGESINEAFEAVADLDLDGFLFNCTYPEAIEAGLTTLATMTDKPIGGYPNRVHIPDEWTLDGGGEGIREDLTTKVFVEAGLRAIEAGASMYGGCCAIRPEDIAALAQAVHGDGATSP